MEVSSVLWIHLEKLLELSSLKEKETQEVRSQLQELNIKREVEAKEAQSLALKYSELVIEHNNQIDRVKSLQIENEKLAKGLPYLILVFRICISMFRLAYFNYADVFP